MEARTLDTLNAPRYYPSCRSWNGVGYPGGREGGGP